MSNLTMMLARETGLSFADVGRILSTAPRRYKVYSIPKRAGGLREIAQPARELKMLQRAFSDVVLNSLPVHSAAAAYRRGLSIRHNALQHAGGGPILKMDFKDFFPSIRSADWEAYCDANGVLDPSDRIVSSRLLFRQAKAERTLRLSIGAPSSPSVSNVLMERFDTIVSQNAGIKGITYTRYADDLTFSGQRIGMLRDMIDVVRFAVRNIEWPKLTINVEKTTFVTAKYRRVVTGIVLANDGKLSLGRDAKRLISARVHHASLGKLSASELERLAGYLSFANVAEPTFLEFLRRKYGAQTVDRIRHAAIRAPRTDRFFDPSI